MHLLIYLVFIGYGTIECSAAAHTLTLPSVKSSAKKPTHHHAKALGVFTLADLNTPRAHSTNKNKSELLMDQFNAEIAHFNKLAAEKTANKPLLRRLLQKIDGICKQFSAAELDFNPKIKINLNAARSKLNLLESKKVSSKKQSPPTAAAHSTRKPIKASQKFDKKQEKELSETDLALKYLKTTFLHSLNANFIQNADPLNNIKALFKSPTIRAINLAAMQKALDGMKHLDERTYQTYYWALKSHKHTIKTSLEYPQ
jgi:hypothetical protein